ncbi:hypothetical protein Ciccas_007981 [Cichlidogyrus casuarinus]|uniref:Uncharacterized protein n=1 Tax=Cichlidogyrus casuarinus TaxID=1844966 RepID=A0ABD2Q215_9PLAT
MPTYQFVRVNIRGIFRFIAYLTDDHNTVRLAVTAITQELMKNLPKTDFPQILSDMCPKVEALIQASVYDDEERRYCVTWSRKFGAEPFRFPSEINTPTGWKEISNDLLENKFENGPKKPQYPMTSEWLNPESRERAFTKIDLDVVELPVITRTRQITEFDRRLLRQLQEIDAPEQVDASCCFFPCWSWDKKRKTCIPTFFSFW